MYAHFLICFVLCDAQSKYHCVRPLAELEIAHSDTPEDGVLVFTHDEHEVEEPDDNQEPTKQWGIHLFYQARANFYLIRNEGNPVFSLNELILEYINVPNKPAFPTPEQMRSRAQHLSLSRTTDANFSYQGRRQRMGSATPPSSHCRGVAPDGSAQGFRPCARPRPHQGASHCAVHEGSV